MSDEKSVTRSAAFDLAAGPDTHVEALQEGNGPIVLLDSEEGITMLLKWAKAHRFILNGYHQRLAKKYGVATDGVMFSRPLPVASPIKWLNEEEAAAIWPKADK